MRSWRGLLVLSVLAACAPASAGHRGLHYMDGELVRSRPAPARSYEAYLRARLALEASPARLDAALEHIVVALRHDPRDPHLWTTRGEIEWRNGDPDAALISCRRALELRPGYEPARTLLVQVQGGDASAAAKTSAGGS